MSLPEGLMLVLLHDKNGDVVPESDTPTVINHAIVNDESKFSTIAGAEIGDVREAGYTLVPIEDINAVIKKGRDIRFYQKA
jgi:hypothetical protein